MQQYTLTFRIIMDGHSACTKEENINGLYVERKYKIMSVGIHLQKGLSFLWNLDIRYIDLQSLLVKFVRKKYHENVCKPHYFVLKFSMYLNIDSCWNSPNWNMVMRLFCINIHSQWNMKLFMKSYFAFFHWWLESHAHKLNTFGK